MFRKIIRILIASLLIASCTSYFSDQDVMFVGKEYSEVKDYVKKYLSCCYNEDEVAVKTIRVDFPEGYNDNIDEFVFFFANGKCRQQVTISKKPVAVGKKEFLVGTYWVSEEANTFINEKGDKMYLRHYSFIGEKK